MPHVPHVMPIEPGELLDFCGEAGYAARLERAGSWFTPPDYNVGMTDWERSLRLRCAPPALLVGAVSSCGCRGSRGKGFVSRHSLGIL